ncbi:MAG: GGDEF domain-containing protein [Bacilli bacterium]|nr:GGDEF domain-containing protein [Bacilli bacterium]
MMSGEIKHRKIFIIILIPLILNALVYLLMFVPKANELVVYFDRTEGGLAFGGGPLRFSSHVISALYILYLLYISFTKISSKHITHGLTIITCTIFVVAEVIIESFFNANGDIHILPTTIALSAMVYYFTERAQIDTLTGLFNRETYYHDVDRMGKSVNGVIQFDMNGLKYINDTFGHIEGDNALSTIAHIITKSAKRNMYAYRLGGDEFILLAINSSDAQLNEVIEKFKTKINETKYHCSISYAFRDNRSLDVEELLKEAEKKMYEDKAEFYKNSSIERRKR